MYLLSVDFGADKFREDFSVLDGLKNFSSSTKLCVNVLLERKHNFVLIQIFVLTQNLY